ncbi:MAG: hypothetical protein IJ240_03260 [Clostridia bacterium]|nr:hypothetical protein [Clostridia bacterium]
MEERLEKLPETADQLLSNVRADSELKYKIRTAAAAPQRAKRVFAPRLAVPALCAALVLVAVGVFGVTRIFSPADRELQVTSIAAGVSSASPNPSLRADLPPSSVSLNKGSVSFRELFAGSGGNFPMITVDGRVYRLLNSPSKLNSRNLGSALGAVSSGGITSNAVEDGETVYQVSGMGNAMVAANVDGKLRVFQRVSSGSGSSGDSLKATIGSATVNELSLSGVGSITDKATIQQLMGQLSGASYVNGECKKSGQALYIAYANGTTVQLYVSGDQLSACGTWSCPGFFTAFNAALQ